VRWALASPTVERRGVNDRDQSLDGTTKLFAELQEPLTLLGPGVNLLRQSRPQNPILFFQVLDYFAIFGLGGRGDQDQQRVVILFIAVCSQSLIWDQVTHSRNTALCP
jgi:hypothetical protein